jgi:small GTP-binding protein
MNDIQETMKVAYVGPASVGKTSILNCVCYSDYANPREPPTIGTAQRQFFHSKKGQETRIVFWDTAGQEKYAPMVNSYLRDSELVVLVFAVNQKDSFNTLDAWISRIKDVVPDAPVVLVGNKIDAEDRVVSATEGEQYAAQNEFKSYQETSAVSKQGVIELLNAIIAELRGRVHGSSETLLTPASSRCC